MNESESKIQRFAPPQHIVPQLNLDTEDTVFAPPKPAEPATQEHIAESKAARQTFLLQQKINAARGKRPRYGEITGNDAVAHTARLQLEVEQKRLDTHN